MVIAVVSYVDISKEVITFYLDDGTDGSIQARKWLYRNTALQSQNAPTGFGDIE